MAKFIDKNGEPLSDEELMEASGGVEINPEHHWYGNKYAICNKCGCKDWDIIDCPSVNRLQIRCKKCGNIEYRDMKS